mmetsp:Transcript_39509/g.92452  ORF Transcript_39509/g.92452 Transcript_39509/m.92452 type:complete len:333 (-) Transcript_39509:310-1308(-)
MAAEELLQDKPNLVLGLLVELRAVLDRGGGHNHVLPAAVLLLLLLVPAVLLLLHYHPSAERPVVAQHSILDISHFSVRLLPLNRPLYRLDNLINHALRVPIVTQVSVYPYHLTPSAPLQQLLNASPWSAHGGLTGVVVHHEPPPRVLAEYVGSKHLPRRPGSRHLLATHHVCACASHVHLDAIRSNVGAAKHLVLGLEHVCPHAEDLVVAHERLGAGVYALHLRAVEPHLSHQINVLCAERGVEVRVCAEDCGGLVHVHAGELVADGRRVLKVLLLDRALQAGLELLDHPLNHPLLWGQAVHPGHDAGATPPPPRTSRAPGPPVQEGGAWQV